MVPCGSLKVAALARQDLAVPTLRMAADHGEFAFRALRISPCKSVASGGMRVGKQPDASRPSWSKHSGLTLITNARRRLRSRVIRF
jgi:hypothetical protein